MTKTSKAQASTATVRKSNKAPASTAKALRGAGSQAASPNAPPKALSKQQQLAALLIRDEGATLEQMMVATG